MMKKITACMLAACMIIAGLTGCKKFDDKTGGNDKETTAAASVETTGATAEATETEAESTGEFEYKGMSYGIADNGFIEDMKALDYVTLPDFSNVTFAKEDIECTDEDLQTAMESFVLEFPTEVYDRAVEDGDTVIIDYVGSTDGVEFSGGSATGAEVTAGSSDYIDDFLTQIIGHMPGETMDVNVTFPETYANTDLAGKDALFVTTIDHIVEYPAVSDITDEWIAEHKTEVDEYFGEDKINSLDDLHTFISDYYYDTNLENAIYNYLADANNISISELSNDAYIVSYNIWDSQYYFNYGMTVEDVRSYYGDSVLTQIESDGKMLMIYQAIAEDQNWNITEADLEEVTGTADNDALIESYGMGYLAQMVIYYRCYDYLKELVKVE